MGILFPVLGFAQILNMNIPVPLSRGISGEAIATTDKGYRIITRSDSHIFATPILSTTNNYVLGTPTEYFPNSSDYSIFYRDIDNSPTPFFYKTGTVENEVNRDIIIEGIDNTGTSVFSLTLDTPQDDYGIQAIGTKNGALATALRKTADSELYQIVVIKTDTNGKIEWETDIPTQQTGYDDSFTGEDASGNYLTKITPEPFVSKIKEVVDGYVLVNNHRVYFPPGLNNIFATIIKLDLNGNLLWSSQQVIPTQGNIVGSAPSSAGNSRYFIGDVIGLKDGKTYLSYSGGEDFQPCAQVAVLDKKGATIANYSTVYLATEDASFQVKKFKERIYWLRRTETFNKENGAIFDHDFSIVDITDGFDDVTKYPVAFLSPTPDASYIPNDMQMTPEGNFLVTGAKYPIFNGDVVKKSEPFIVLLEANSISEELEFTFTDKSNNPETISDDYPEVTFSTGAGSSVNTDLRIKGIQKTNNNKLAYTTRLNVEDSAPWVAYFSSNELNKKSSFIKFKGNKNWNMSTLGDKKSLSFILDFPVFKTNKFSVKYKTEKEKTDNKEEDSTSVLISKNKDSYSTHLKNNVKKGQPSKESCPHQNKTIE